jgi:hypothetical protein
MSDDGISLKSISHIPDDLNPSALKQVEIDVPDTLLRDNTGGPAYPTNNWQKVVPMSTGYHEGMTLRDYFAAKAMQAIVSRPDVQIGSDFSYEAYMMADAMLKARQS